MVRKAPAAAQRTGMKEAAMTRLRGQLLYISNRSIEEPGHLGVFFYE